MSLLRRTISTPKCLFPLSRRTIASPFSTSTNHTRPRKPRTSKIPPPLASSKMLNKQGTSAPTWPRPTQIPFQGTLANSVNLFGNIVMPIQLHTTPDGKHMASTSISQQSVSSNWKCSHSLPIPVVFEGDLAHTVMCHVKQDDCVYVTGKLSFEPLPFVLSENQGKFYVIGDELNFVQGLETKEAKPVQMDVGNDNAVKEEVGNRKRRVDGKRLDLDSSTPVRVYGKLEELNLENKIEEMEIGVLNTEKKSNKIEKKEVELLNTEKKSNKIEEKEVELLNTEKKRSGNVGGTKKDGDPSLDSWKDHAKNPMDWFDNREKKSSGLLKANFPDFKHKINGTPLWLSSAPKGMLPDLERLGLDVDVQVQIQVPKGRPTKGGVVKNEDSWKSLVENPDKWWDCRSKKTSIKSPDFKHKDTGEALWLNNSPEWVLSQLPHSENEQHVSTGNKKDVGGLDVDAAQVQVPKWGQGKGGKVKNEDSWKSLVENPDKWWDNRSDKTNIKAPDFKHKDTGEALWLNSSPGWVLSQLPPSKNGRSVAAGYKKAFVA